MRRSDCRWIDSSSRSSPSDIRRSCRSAGPSGAPSIRSRTTSTTPGADPLLDRPRGLGPGPARDLSARARAERPAAQQAEGVGGPGSGRGDRRPRPRRGRATGGRSRRRGQPRPLARRPPLHGDHHGAPRHAAQGLPLRRRGAHGGGRRVLREPRQPEGRELRLARGHGRRGRRRRAGGPARGGLRRRVLFLQGRGSARRGQRRPPRGHRSLGEARREGAPRVRLQSLLPRPHGADARARAEVPAVSSTSCLPIPGSALSSRSPRNTSRTSSAPQGSRPSSDSGPSPRRRPRRSSSGRGTCARRQRPRFDARRGRPRPHATPEGRSPARPVPVHPRAPSGLTREPAPG